MRAFRPRREHTALVDVSAERIAEYCRVHVTTARRWKRGEDPSHSALQWIRICSTGELGGIDPAFEGWRLYKGKLISPEGFIASSGDILSLPFLRRLIAHYQNEQRLPRQADWIAGEWLPAREIDSA